MTHPTVTNTCWACRTFTFGRHQPAASPDCTRCDGTGHYTTRILTTKARVVVETAYAVEVDWEEIEGPPDWDEITDYERFTYADSEPLGPTRIELQDTDGQWADVEQQAAHWAANDSPESVYRMYRSGAVDIVATLPEIIERLQPNGSRS